jgi:hypothetical protein
MRIRDLLENNNGHFNSDHFIKQTDDGNEIDFDLADDLVFYLNNDDDIYRRFLHPAILKCIDRIKAEEEVKYTIFKSAVSNGYKRYVQQYPIRELPDTIDPKIWKEVCKKIFDEVSTNMKDGTYDT